jgi:hypothetical protein
MAKEPRKIKVPQGSELARLLTQAETAPLLLEKDGELFRLERMEKEPEDIFAQYDPEAALAGIKAAAGSWKDIDVKAFKEWIYRAREEGSRPSSRP